MTETRRGKDEHQSREFSSPPASLLPREEDERRKDEPIKREK